jgi:hypothetical protein
MEEKMRKSIFALILIVIIPLISCTTIPKTRCPENEFSNLNTIPLYITTNDTVTLYNYNKKSKTTALLKDIYIEKYKIENNLLEIEVAESKSQIRLSKIEKIEYDGLYDKEIGIISQNELKSNMNYSPTLWGILTGIIGLYAGGAIANLINPYNLDVGSGTSLLFGALVGATVGTIVGYNFAFNKNINSAIEKIKEKRNREKITFSGNKSSSSNTK